MTKLLCYIVVCCFSAGLAFGQKTEKKPVVKEWKSLNKNIGYDKSKDYKGPKKGEYTYPQDLKNPTYTSGQGSTSSGTPIQPYQGKTYSQKQIQSGKIVPPNPGGYKKGTLKKNPNIVEPEPVEFPEAEEEETPSNPNYTTNSNTFQSNDVSWSGWKYVGYIILFALLVFILYLVISSVKPGEKTIAFTALEEDLNPETISKTELELRLEEAENNGDFKECVRIYFLFAMKELLNRKLIYWKKEKTNMHYIIEMQGKAGLKDFEAIVSKYDIVWYGDYDIDRAAYNAIQPELLTAYKQLEKLP